LAKATAEQLKLINKFAKVPLTEDNCYTHGFRLIGTKLITDRYLKLDKSLLDVYLKDVKNGDVVQIADHSMGGIKGLLKVTLPFGRFFDGELVEEDGETNLNGYMYMKTGQKTYAEPFTTDDLSEQLDAGTLDDSSVGICWDRSECSICGNDIRDYDNCQHYPGRTYKVKDKDYLCYVIAKPIEGEASNACMLENSIVGVGAYPDAGHLAKEGQTEKPKYHKINNMMELKLIPQEEPVFCLFSADHAEILTRTEYEPDVARLHDLCHKSYQLMKEQGDTTGQAMRELTQKHTEAVERLITQQEHYLEDALDGNLPGNLKSKSIRREEDELNALVKEIFDKAGVDPEQIEAVTEQGFKLKDGTEKLIVGADYGAHAEGAIDKIELESAKTKVAELEPLAEDGKAFRKEVIDEALATGVRAMGNDFPADTWKGTFSTMSIQAIRDITKTFNAQAGVEIPTGRQTIPGGFNKTDVNNIPDEAYRA